MSVPSQLVFDFDHRPSLGGDDFLVAPCNSEAVGWIDRWPDWPGPALVVHGSGGCGKSHLGQVFRGLSGGIEITLEMLAENDPPALLANATACLLEDAGQIPGKQLERALFHLYNWCREEGRWLMLTATEPPAGWSFTLPDLASRMKAAVAVEIGAPDDALITAVMVKQFADRQLAVDSDVVAFVQARMERSFTFIRALVEAADKLAMAEHRRITVPLMGKVLQQLNEQ